VGHLPEELREATVTNIVIAQGMRCPQSVRQNADRHDFLPSPPHRRANAPPPGRWQLGHTARKHRTLDTTKIAIQDGH